jgi:hypothetical protein
VTKRNDNLQGKERIEKGWIGERGETEGGERKDRSCYWWNSGYSYKLIGG